MNKMPDKYFLTSWPFGRLRPVKLLGENSNIQGGIYIRYLDGKGGTDTTTDDFLFDIPDDIHIDKHKADMRELLEGLKADILTRANGYGEYKLSIESIDFIIDRKLGELDER